MIKGAIFIGIGIIMFIIILIIEIKFMKKNNIIFKRHDINIDKITIAEVKKEGNVEEEGNGTELLSMNTELLDKDEENTDLL